MDPCCRSKLNADTNCERAKCAAHPGQRHLLAAAQEASGEHGTLAHDSRVNMSRYRVCSEPIAPHGILGQTFDCDMMALHGRSDSYATLDDGRATTSRRTEGGIVTTQAQAEGALKGVARDYRFKGTTPHRFRFLALWCHHLGEPDSPKLALIWAEKC
eukprot:3501150-Prymnesium_polylepis.1